MKRPETRDQRPESITVPDVSGTVIDCRSSWVAGRGLRVGRRITVVEHHSPERAALNSVGQRPTLECISYEPCKGDIEWISPLQGSRFLSSYVGRCPALLNVRLSAFTSALQTQCGVIDREAGRTSSRRDDSLGRKTVSPISASRRDASLGTDKRGRQIPLPSRMDGSFGRGIPTGCRDFFTLFSTERSIPTGCWSALKAHNVSNRRWSASGTGGEQTTPISPARAEHCATFSPCRADGHSMRNRRFRSRCSLHRRLFTLRTCGAQSTATLPHPVIASVSAKQSRHHQYKK